MNRSRAPPRSNRGHIWDAITQITVWAGYDHGSCVLGHNDRLPTQPEQRGKCIHQHISIWFTGMQISCFGSLNCRLCSRSLSVSTDFTVSLVSENIRNITKFVEWEETKKKHTETWLFCRPYRTPRTSWLRRRGRRESKRRKRVEGKPRPQTTSELFRPDLYSCGETKHAHANSSNWQHIYKSGLNTDAVFLHTCCLMYAENVNNRSAVCHIYRLISLNENTSDKTREGKSQYYYFLYRIIPTKFCWLFSSSSDKTSKNF